MPAHAKFDLSIQAAVVSNYSCLHSYSGVTWKLSTAIEPEQVKYLPWAIRLVLLQTQFKNVGYTAILNHQPHKAKIEVL